MAEALLSEVEEFAGSNDKGPWLKYTLKNTGGQPIAVTFDTALGTVAKSLIGHAITIETRPASNPKYAPTLVSIKATQNGGFTPPEEPHHKPVVGGDKDRAITRMACLKAAAELWAGQGGSLIEDQTDKPLAVMKAAQRFETWVYRDIDDVPF